MKNPLPKKLKSVKTTDKFHNTDLDLAKIELKEYTKGAKRLFPTIRKNFKNMGLSPELLEIEQEAYKQYSQKDYTGALENFKKALLIHLQSQNYLYIKTTAKHLMRKNHKVYESNFQHYAQTPENYFSLYDAGIYYLLKNDIENAIKWLKIAYSNLPLGDKDDMDRTGSYSITKLTTSTILGNAMVQAEQFEDAFWYLDDAIEMNPQMPFSLITKAIALVQTSDYNGAIEYMKKAIEVGTYQCVSILEIIYGMKRCCKINDNLNPINIIDDTKFISTDDHHANLVSFMEKDLLMFYNILQERSGIVSNSEFASLVETYLIYLIFINNSTSNSVKKSVIFEFQRQLIQATQNSFKDFLQNEDFNIIFTSVDDKLKSYIGIFEALATILQLTGRKNNS